jgi:hypothetical protein
MKAPSIILAMKRVWVRLAITQLNENAIKKDPPHHAGD